MRLDGMTEVVEDGTLLDCSFVLVERGANDHLGDAA